MDRTLAFMTGMITSMVVLLVLALIWPPDRPMEAVNILDVPVAGVTAVRNTTKVPAPVAGYIQPGCTMLTVMECPEVEEDEEE